ncbi:MAG: Smr/MutS family protein [Acidobacteria bacterium]|nr:Smr/MutS family protein [Acidobacteriota bacterium]
MRKPARSKGDIINSRISSLQHASFRMLRIRIIHGFGTGALKNFVHHTLKNHDLIAAFTFAPPNQGGNGATIAELKL